MQVPAQALMMLAVWMLLGLCSGQFSQSFQHYIREIYGEGARKKLTREDFGVNGSFGGGNHWAGVKTRHHPVILVHGVGNTIGDFQPNAQYFLDNGYGQDEVYGTTYGEGQRVGFFLDTLECEYVKVIRMLIHLVSSFTSSKVNIIAYSFGGPIARKAILGGKCVDAHVHLGPPLTDLVHTFVSVAGSNNGAIFCAAAPLAVCNPINGLYCNSSFLFDINSHQASERYEAQNIYTIESTADDVVGYQACGQLTSTIAGENQTFTFDGLQHTPLLLDTIDLQFNLTTYE